MIRLTLIALLAATILVLRPAAARADTEWCGRVNGPDTAFTLQAHNLPCGQAYRIAYQYWFGVGIAPAGYACNTAGTMCWTSGRARWFRGVQPPLPLWILIGG
jgi:hypothetical protein